MNNEHDELTVYDELQERYVRAYDAVTTLQAELVEQYDPTDYKTVQALAATYTRRPHRRAAGAG